jgi:hypothetical protein
MTISIRQLTGAVVVSFCVGAFIAPVGTRSQGAAPSVPATAGDPQQAHYMMVEFMKVPEGKEDGWLKLEREWKPLHALRVKDGSIQSWAAIAQRVPGDESNGPVHATVTTYRGWPDPTKMNFAELVKKAYPQGDVNTLMQQTESARRMVRTEIWEVLEQTGRPMMGTK